MVTVGSASECDIRCKRAAYRAHHRARTQERGARKKGGTATRKESSARAYSKGTGLDSLNNFIITLAFILA